MNNNYFLLNSEYQFIAFDRLVAIGCNSYNQTVDMHSVSENQTLCYFSKHLQQIFADMTSVIVGTGRVSNALYVTCKAMSPSCPPNKDGSQERNSLISDVLLLMTLHPTCKPPNPVWRCYRDPTFSRFSRTPTCDRQTDRQTHD